jgi:hypothetical protein
MKSTTLFPGRYVQGADTLNLTLSQFITTSVNVVISTNADPY